MRYSCAFTLVALIAFQSVMLTYCQVITKHGGCPTKCGNVTIPYPFGIGNDCAFNQNFIIYCNQTKNPPTLSLKAKGSLPILDISVDGYLRKYTFVARDCYNQTGGDRHYSNPSSSLPSMFFYSSAQNKFTAIGCDTRSEVDGRTRGGEHDGGTRSGGSFALGCISYCISSSTVSNGSCSGIGCCQTGVPSGLSRFLVSLGSYKKHTLVHDFNPCSYGFIADKDYFNFTTASLLKMPNVVPTVVDWVIDNVNCATARRNASTYACKNRHSECSDYQNGLGYRCSCSSGYAGNPYLPDGCDDVDECKKNENECIHKCHNLEGDKGKYRCSCPKWYHGDGRRSGEGCKLNKHNIILVLVGDGILLAIIVAGILMLHHYRRKKKQAILKENFFKQNGGFILLERISQNQEGSNSISTMRIFKSEELEEATNNFSEDEICGRGGFGTVYKGRLSNGTIVAIKKSKVVDEDQVEQFINEITILSQINHKNVVKFLGCCLEQAVPLLVYEFVTNGTLSDHIHDQSGYRPKMLWQTRLKIAAETAGVLAYLHTDHSPQVIHRDIKPTNILLDDGLTTKISDFGASRLNPKNEIEMCTMVQGTMGYLDPEYLQTSQLTEKSDVYSFGVVLVELLTGLKVVSFERAEEDRSLVLYFMSLTKEDDILGILDRAMMKEDNIEEIKQVLKIAKMCIRVKGEERPTMKEIAMELESLYKNRRHQWVKNETTFEESEHLLGEVSRNQYGDSIEMTGYSSKPEHLLLRVDDGR